MEYPHYVGTDIEKAEETLQILESGTEKEKELFATLNNIEEAKKKLTQAVGGYSFGNEPDKSNQYLDHIKKVLPPWIKKEIELVKNELKFLSDEDEFIKSTIEAEQRIEESILKQKIYEGWAENERKTLIKEYKEIDSLKNNLIKILEDIKKYLNYLLEDLEFELKILEHPNEWFFESHSRDELAFGRRKWMIESIEKYINNIVENSKHILDMLKDEEKRQVFIERCEYVTREMIKLFDKYAGRIEYGNIRTDEPVAHISKKGVSWQVWYNMFFGSSAKPSNWEFDAETGEFKIDMYNKETRDFTEKTTTDPKVVVEHYRKLIENIPKDREEHIRKYFLHEGKNIDWKAKIKDFEERLVNYYNGKYETDISKLYRKKDWEDILDELECPPFYKEKFLAAFG